MKATITNDVNPLRQKFKAGELIITGSGSVALLSKDFNPTIHRHYSGVILKAGVGVSVVDGEMGDYFTVVSGQVRLFNGQITLQNN